MKEYKIEKNIPVPAIKQTKSRFPFYDMKVGDSFIASKNERAGVQSSAQSLYYRKGMKFITRTVDDENVRVWRVE